MLQPCSLKTLKKQLTEAKATAAAKQGGPDQGEQPLEWGRILTGEDFERIRCCVGLIAAEMCCG